MHGVRQGQQDNEGQIALLSDLMQLYSVSGEYPPAFILFVPACSYMNDVKYVLGGNRTLQSLP